MVRTSKSAATTETKASRSKKESAPAPAPTPAAEPVVEAAPVAEATAESYTDKMTEFNAKLQQLGSIFTSLKADFKTLQKSVERDMKAAVKAATARKKRDMSDRPKSGFVKPTRISDELAKFLNKEVGTEMARTEVSKEINQYVVANNLRDKNNGRIILPDNKLGKLLKVGKTDEVTYFNLQRYLKPHFIKAEPSA
jgi:upstream activation factor subunit UAF30